MIEGSLSAVTARRQLREVARFWVICPMKGRKPKPYRVALPDQSGGSFRRVFHLRVNSLCDPSSPKPPKGVYTRVYTSGCQGQHPRPGVARARHVERVLVVSTGGSEPRRRAGTSSPCAEWKEPEPSRPHAGV